MANNNSERFDHGEHNESACELLNLNGKFPDWTITTAFYASLHFVTSKIFPFKHRPKPDAKEITFVSLDQWQKFKNYASHGRHELLSGLVDTYCNEVQERYDWLLSHSWNARYHEHKHDPHFVQYAIACMKAIKKHCEPSKKK